jgi:hypothetical protein
MSYVWLETAMQEQGGGWMQGSWTNAEISDTLIGAGVWERVKGRRTPVQQ